METVVLIIHVVATVSLVVLVLLQQGKGADLGSAFGSGASNTVFGSVGSASFLTKLTAGLALVFFVTSLTLAYMANQQIKSGSEFDIPEMLTSPPDQQIIEGAIEGSLESSDTPEVISVSVKESGEDIPQEGFVPPSVSGDTFDEESIESQLPE